MKKLNEYTLDELLALHPDDITVEEYGFTAGGWERRIATLQAAGTPCEGCKHVAYRFPYPSLYPCSSCTRACEDHFEREGEPL